ncbi:MAG: hypothetical protein HXX09_11820 [Bacteroidetes bacterium]|nr:hypothetical protein [Bacteroidota bacterium]
MHRTFVIIYSIITAAIALTTTIFEIQPALFLINVFAPHEGDKYSIALVVLPIWIALLSPLFLYLIITKLLRQNNDEHLSNNRTGILVKRKKAFQSAMVGIPVFINDKKAGIVDNGRTKFFDVPTGIQTVQVGEGKAASEKIQVTLYEGKQIHFELEIKPSAFQLKYLLKQL